MIKTLNISLLISYCALIYWFSDQPSLQPPMSFQYQDKVIHVVAYFIMGILAWRSFIAFIKMPIKNAILCFVFCALYGLSDEWHQSFVPGRFCDLFDLYADMLGAAMATLLLYTISSLAALPEDA